jgi:hypothetical protein
MIFGLLMLILAFVYAWGNEWDRGIFYLILFIGAKMDLIESRKNDQ